MSTASTIDYVNPFAKIAKKHGGDLTHVIAEIVANNAGAAPPIEQLMDHVVDFLKTEYSISDLLTEQALTAALGNTINTYLAGTTAGAIGWVGLDSVPPTSLESYLIRLKQQVSRSKNISDPFSTRMLAIAIGRNDLAYWQTEMANPTSDWAPFFTGDFAIDTATIPYWVGAAMRGSAVGFQQLKAFDTPGTMNHLMSALGGSIILAAGRVLYGWVPKKVASRRPITQLNPTGPSTASIYWICCAGEDDLDFEASSDAEAQTVFNQWMSNAPNTSCYLQ